MENIKRSYEMAVESMTRLNRNGAKLMHKYGAKGCTDVTGFGIYGHSTNLAENQKACVQFNIHTLPVIQGMAQVDKALQDKYNLRFGNSSETSGGLLVILPRDQAQNFCDELSELDQQPAWIIGDVVESQTRGAEILEGVQIIDI